MNCCTQGNNATLWILIALFVLGSKDGFFDGGSLCGCTLPVIAALQGSRQNARNLPQKQKARKKNAPEPLP